jgi:cytosine/adenosine deaminase-related metal-dependent hydrolase
MNTIYFAKWILLENGEVLINGAISISESIITAVGPRSKVRTLNEDRVVNLGDVLLMPGLINTHIHLEDAVVRGNYKSYEETFTAWSNKKQTKIRNTPPEKMLLSMDLTIKELIAEGITGIVDCTRTGLSAPILNNSSIRSWIIDELHSDDDSSEKQCWEQIRKKHRNAHSETTGIGPYGLFSLAPKIQHEIIEFTKKNNTLWATHLAESAEELQAFSEKKGDLYFYATRKRPWPFGDLTNGSMNYGIDNNLIPKGGICIHCNYVNGQELSYMASNSVSLVICHRYSIETGHKLLPIDVALNRNVNICLGTEGIASKGCLSLFDELFALKQHYPHISAKEMLRWVTINPAKALNVENKLGSLADGKLADFIAVRFAHDSDSDILEELLVEEPEIALVVINGEEIIFNC